MPRGMECGSAGDRNREDYLGGWVLGRKGYKCRRLLGKGAFSAVYCVEDETDGRVYACKISRDARLLEREAQVMAALGHPLFTTCFAFWREAGLGFLLSEYVAGCSLEEMLARRGRFSARQTVHMGIALAEGLAYLHGRPEKYLFRDVKPANIMVGQAGGVKLVDFGCVCSLEEGIFSRAGTPGFAAPEQLEGGRQLTPACDVYGLGRTMEEMLGGDRTRKSVGWPERKEKSRGLRRILEACRQEDVSRRIREMEQLLSALEQWEKRTQ